MSLLRLSDENRRQDKINGIEIAANRIKSLISKKIIWYREQGGSMSGIRIACLEAFMNEMVPACQQLIKEAKQ